MHELGVVFYVIKDCEKVAKENNVKKVKRVTIEVGEVSGIIHHYLDDCYKWAIKKSDVLRDSILKIETIDAYTYCEDCSRMYPTVEFGKTCPFCNSKRTYLKQGNEFKIKEIEVFDEE